MPFNINENQPASSTASAADVSCTDASSRSAPDGGTSPSGTSSLTAEMAEMNLNVSEPTASKDITATTPDNVGEERITLITPSGSSRDVPHPDPIHFSNRLRSHPEVLQTACPPNSPQVPQRLPSLPPDGHTDLSHDRSLSAEVQQELKQRRYRSRIREGASAGSRSSSVASSGGVQKQRQASSDGRGRRR